MKASEVLENTTLKFGRYKLYDPKDDSYCAFGVLMHRMGWDGRSDWEWERKFAHKVYDEFGMNLELGVGLTHINNESDSFEEPIKWLKEHGL